MTKHNEGKYLSFKHGAAQAAAGMPRPAKASDSWQAGYRWAEEITTRQAVLDVEYAATLHATTEEEAPGLATRKELEELKQLYNAFADGLTERMNRLEAKISKEAEDDGEGPVGSQGMLYQIDGRWVCVEKKDEDIVISMAQNNSDEYSPGRGLIQQHPKVRISRGGCGEPHRGWLVSIDNSHQHVCEVSMADNTKRAPFISAHLSTEVRRS